MGDLKKLAASGRDTEMSLDASITSASMISFVGTSIHTVFGNGLVSSTHWEGPSRMDDHARHQ